MRAASNHAGWLVGAAGKLPSSVDAEEVTSAALDSHNAQGGLGAV